MIRRPLSSTLFPYTTLFRSRSARSHPRRSRESRARSRAAARAPAPGDRERSEEHTSELQSQSNLVCRLLLEKKKKKVLSQDANHSPDNLGRYTAQQPDARTI